MAARQLEQTEQRLDLSMLKIVQDNYEYHQMLKRTEEELAERNQRAAEYSSQCVRRREIEIVPMSSTAALCALLIMLLIAISGSMIF